jgi:phosphate acetyltransferase
MTKTIYIASAEPYSGKSVISLGLVNMLLGKGQKVGFFKPIINQEPGALPDAKFETLRSYFNLPLRYEDTFAFTRVELLRLIEANGQGEIIDKIISQYKQLEESNDFIVVEGSDFRGEGLLFEFDTNVSIAKNLGVPVILVVSGEGKTTAHIINAVLTQLRSFEAREVQVLAIVVNKVNPVQAGDVRDLLVSQLPPDTILAVIPMDKDLKNPTVKEIFETLGGKLLVGQELLGNQVDNFVTGAMQVPQFLHHFKDNLLIVTPGDRGDIIICAVQANLSANYPRVAGIVLTAGIEPDEPVMRLIAGLDTVVPILAVDTGTFQTSAQISSIQSRITPDNTKKIQQALLTFERFIDVRALEQKIITYEAENITPHMFQYQLVKRARKQRKRIVLPEGQEERILRAAARLISQDIVDLTLLGDPAQIAATVKRLGLPLDLDRLQILDPVHSPYYEDYVHTLYELRKHKNVELEMAYDLLTDVSYFGTMMVHKGHADGMVSGAVHTTLHTIRPALQIIKTRPGVSLVSSVFFMCLPDRVSVFGDCAVNPNPTAEQLAEIAISSAESSQRFGIEPRIAMLSYSSGTSGEGEEVEKVRRATELVKQKRPDLKVEGPIQYDAAVDPVVGRQKLPDSPVAGQASVLIFPDLNTGNNTYKAVQRETGALAIGPMLQGLNKPVNDLSRGCTVDDIFNTVVITAIQAQE